MKPNTPLADPAFPTRDAVLRHGLNALREQRGVSHEKFGRRLNAAIADMIPAKGQAAGIMMADGQIGPEDKPLAERALNEIHEAMVALAEMGERIKSSTR